MLIHSCVELRSTRLYTLPQSQDRYQSQLRSNKCEEYVLPYCRILLCLLRQFDIDAI
jgi:hypothetical protein